jgi:RNA polymerase subunit RPABC4/transcription elongation factor Spt4
MGKEKKKLGIKTTRYYTKICTKCSFEYPNWFTNCPKCGASWDNTEVIPVSKDSHKKTIKIVVKITEETFNKAIFSVNLIFSADRGNSWYQMEMDQKMDYFIAEIAEVPIGSVIIYYVEVYLEDGEKIVENNEGKYFFYKVGVPIEEAEPETTPQESEAIKKSIDQSTTKPQKYQKPPTEAPPEKPRVTREMVEQSTAVPQEENMQLEKSVSKEYTIANATIFGKPQTEIDPDLKVCIHCNSKIKKMWSICPICGKSL